jgi:hypothetical protein
MDIVSGIALYCVFTFLDFVFKGVAIAVGFAFAKKFLKV